VGGGTGRLSRISGFPPVVGERPRVLILGSMPSEKSLADSEYYAHPRNAFWRIMADLFDIDRDLPYADRLNRLRECRIALWDVLASCERPGSLDSNISNAQPNDFAGLLARHPTIGSVFFNGRRAEDEFRRNVRPTLGAIGDALEYRGLPSTSPANAARSYGQKLADWRAIREALES
jgi:TDG/mug DNA glycosylase family protein